MPQGLIRASLVVAPLLHEAQAVGEAVRLLAGQELPALPVVDGAGRLAGIFGEREFVAALFPGYLGELASSAMIRRTIDETIERRSCGQEPIRKYLTTDHVVVEDHYSDTQLAEIFLHHRVLVIPIATAGRVHALVTRHDFFVALAAKVADASAPEEA